MAESDVFKAQLEEWRAAGVAQPWTTPLLGQLTSQAAPGGETIGWRFEPFADGKTRWIGTADGGGVKQKITKRVSRNISGNLRLGGGREHGK